MVEEGEVEEEVSVVEGEEVATVVVATEEEAFEEEEAGEASGVEEVRLPNRS